MPKREIVEKACFKVLYWTGTRKDRVKGPFEGIAVGPDTGIVDVIVSADGKAIKPPIWRFEPCVYHGLIRLKLQKGRFDHGKYRQKEPG